MAYDGSLIFDTSIDSKGVEDGLKEIQKTADGYTIGKNIFSNLTTDAIQAAGSALKDAAQTGINFEASMSKVQATSGATAQELESLTALAREYGSSTVFSSSECADALNYMAMAGWNVEQMTNGLPGILNLAASAGEDLGTTSDIVTDALTAFGMQAEDSAHFADVLAIASSKSNTNVAMMGETFKYVAPVAGALGYSAEDVAVAVGLMANSGIKAGQAGTSLRAILSNLTEPTDKQTEAMDALGISLTDSEGGMKTLDELLVDMRTSFSGLTEAEQASYASMIGGQEAMSGLLAIVNASDTDFNNLKTAIYDCDGACDQMAATMTDNVSGELKSLESMTEELELSLYDMFKPMLQDALPKVQDGVEWVTENLDEITTVAKPVIAALAAIFAVNKVVSFGKTTLSTVKTIKAALLALNTSNPLGWIALGTAAVAGLSTAMNDMAEKRIEEMEEMREKARSLTESQQKQKEEIEETAEAWDSLHESSKSAAQDSESDLRRAEELEETLSRLVNADGTVKSGTQQKVEEVLTEINELTGSCFELSGNLITENGEVLDSYEKISQSIDDIIAKNRVLSYVNAYEEQYETALTNQTNNALATRDAHYQIEAERGKREAAQREFSEKYRLYLAGDESQAGFDYWTERTKMENAIEDSLTRERELHETLVQAQTNQSEQLSLIDQYETLLAMADQDNYAGAAEVIDKIQGGFIESVYAPIEVLKNQRDEAALHYSELKALAATDGQAVTDEMLQQAEEYAEMTESIYQEAADAAYESGEDVAMGAANGIRNKKSEVEAAISEVAGAVTIAFNAALGIHSPSRVMAEAAAFAGDGVVVGLDESIPLVDDASQNLAQSLISGFDGVSSDMADAAVSGTLGIMNAQGAGAVSAYSPVYREVYSSPPESVPAVTGHSERSQSVSGAPKINVYIGNEEIRDFIVSAVADENANSGGWSI